MKTMDLNFGHTQLKIGEGGAVEVAYEVTPPMLAAAMTEAQRIGIKISDSDLEKLLRAALRVA